MTEEREVAVPPASAAISGVEPELTHHCPSCGGTLMRHGSFYWHAAPTARCQITAWCLSTIDARTRADGVTHQATPAPLTAPASPTPLVASVPTTTLGATVPSALPTTLTTQGATMSKRGGNKPKRVAKPPMPNKGPKAK
jgi:hypothetical protein